MQGLEHDPYRLYVFCDDAEKAVVIKLVSRFYCVIKIQSLQCDPRISSLRNQTAKVVM